MGTFVLFRMCHIFLKVISRLFTSHADSFDESFIADELALTETISESILLDFDKELVTVNFC